LPEVLQTMVELTMPQISAAMMVFMFRFPRLTCGR
jgi:hypothetical protein